MAAGWYWGAAVKATLAALVCVLLSAQAAWSQVELLPRVPRRVLFDVEAVDPPEAATQRALDAALQRVPDFLYSRISELQPVVRVYEPAQANSIVRTVVDPEGSLVSVALIEAGVELQRFELAVTGELDVLTGFVNHTARELAPVLGFVVPEVVVIRQPDDDPRAQVVRDVVLADQLASRFEFTLWASGLMRSLESGDDAGRARIAIDPLAFDATWFFRRNAGLTGSIWLHYSDLLYFGRTPDGDPARDQTSSLFLLPGVGITYRTLQRVSASAGATLYAGPAWVTNDSDVAIGEDEDGFDVWLEAGESTTVFYSLLMLHGGIGLSVTPRWTVRTRFCILISPRTLIGQEEGVNYPSAGSGGMFHYFSLGIGYRR
ncbi:MAG: hypothetical protein EA384_09030 [Spirochaetaceae bacterium]|nr:MAG: hypothetical protein EA384_09030 [Spirochaetaceae bacterium]